MGTSSEGLLFVCIFVTKSSFPPASWHLSLKVLGGSSMWGNVSMAASEWITFTFWTQMSALCHLVLLTSPDMRALDTPLTSAGAWAEWSHWPGAEPRPLTGAGFRPPEALQGKPVLYFRCCNLRVQVALAGSCAHCWDDCRTPENCGNITTINLVLSRHKSEILLLSDDKEDQSFI